MANKKYLDEVGLAYLINMLDNYPDNELLATVISAIQDALDNKNVDLGLTVDAQGYICQTMEVDNNAGSN
jgi:hypothetical protein